MRGAQPSEVHHACPRNPSPFRSWSRGMTRLMFYGPVASRSNQAAQRDSAVQELVIHRAASDALTAQLRCSGQCRSGVLFGTLNDGTLHIDYAAQSTTPARQLGDGLPLAPEGDYLLGWADALTVAHTSALDWQSVWLTAAMPSCLTLWSNCAGYGTPISWGWSMRSSSYFLLVGKKAISRQRRTSSKTNRQVSR